MIPRTVIRALYGIDISHGPLYNLRGAGERLCPPRPGRSCKDAIEVRYYEIQDDC